MSVPICRMASLLMALCICVFFSSMAYAAKDWYPCPVEEWEQPFNMQSPRKIVEYVPLQKASKKWEVCVSIPHVKDDYWMAINYGVVSESERLGIAMHLSEAGGYTNLNRQISQIEDCVAKGADAVVIASISFDGLNSLVADLHDKGIPVIDFANGMSSPLVSAKSLTSFGEMAFKAGEYLANANPIGHKKVKVAWFPGPSGAGWVKVGNVGFLKAVLNSSVEVVEIKYGDTVRKAQLKLIEDTLAAHADLNYIVGTAVTAEAAVDVLRDRGLLGKIRVISSYFTPGVYRSIQRREILGAPTDSPVIQGRIAIDQAIRVLEGKDYLRHVGPELYVIDSSNIDAFDLSSSLAPADYRPKFSVD